MAWIEGIRISDSDRSQWVDNEESLYLDMRRSHKGLARFVRENRTEIDAVIRAVLSAEPES